MCYLPKAGLPDPRETSSLAWGVVWGTAGPPGHAVPGPEMLKTAWGGLLGEGAELDGRPQGQLRIDPAAAQGSESRTCQLPSLFGYSDDTWIHGHKHVPTVTCRHTVCTHARLFPCADSLMRLLWDFRWPSPHSFTTPLRFSHYLRMEPRELSLDSVPAS